MNWLVLIGREIQRRSQEASETNASRKVQKVIEVNWEGTAKATWRFEKELQRLCASPKRSAFRIIVFLLILLLVYVLLSL